MPTNAPTGYETYIYDHRQYPNPNYNGIIHEDRQYANAPLHDPKILPTPENDSHSLPRIMVEPCYASESNDVWLYFREGHSIMLTRLMAEQLRDALINDVWIHFREGHSIMLTRLMAEQLRDALIKVCKKPKQEKVSW